MTAPSQPLSMHPRRWNAAELAGRARVSPSSIDRWVELGLIEADPDGTFDDRAVERARLLARADRRGISDEQVAAATARAGDIVGRFVDRIGVRTAARLSTEEVSQRTGLDLEYLARMRVATGAGDDEWDDEDVAALRSAKMAIDAGFPADAMLQLSRVYADALGRVADAESRLFHFHVHDRLLGEGLDAADAAVVVEQTTAALLELVEPTVLYFHRKALVRAMREDVLVHLAEDVSPPEAIGQLTVTVLFVDLVGFTTMTDELGDVAAASVLDRFSELVRNEAAHCDGRVIKQIGDEFMLVFPHARAAVSYALHLAELTSTERAFPPLRIGAHVGPALYREADYLGATVNLAARVTSKAEPGQLVVTNAVLGVASDLAPVWTPLGACHLKGLSAPVELHATNLSASRPEPNAA